MNLDNRKIDRKTYDQQLIIETSLENRFYSYNKIQPTAFFWKEITATLNQTPICLVPDTLVLNQKENQLMWVYTNQQGYITRQTNINFKDFVYKLSSYSSPNELVAILKRPIFNQKLTYSNDFKLFNSRYLLNSSQQQMGQKQHVMCLQRFVKSNGSKAFLCRTIFSQQSNSECYLITNTRNFFDKNEPENKKFIARPGDKSTIVKSKQGKNLQQTCKYLSQITKYMTFFRGIDISQIVGDFIKDEMGNWWLVNIKAFKLIQKIKKSPKSKNILIANQQLQKERYQKTKLCRYCQKSYLQSELTYKMTMRMIIQTDKYLLHMGKQYNWLKRSDISNIDSHCLYQQHKVCERCFRLYSEIQSLMRVQKSLLIKQGCTLIAHPKQLIFSQTNQQHLRLQAKNKQIHRLDSQLPQVIELGPNSNITTKDQCPIKNDQIINKMIRFRLIVFLNQIDEVVNVNQGCNYYLEFTLFNKRSKYKLNLSLANHKIIPLNKLKVYYFFANSIENLQKQYLNSNASFNIYITTEHKQSQQKKVIGKLQLPFKDLIIPVNSKKDFYKFFQLQNIAYGWGLQGSIGIIPSDRYVTTAKISFQKSEGQIYIPNQNYYYCEQLTEEWIDLIKNKNLKAENRRCMFKQLKQSQTVEKQQLVERKKSTRGRRQSDLQSSKRGSVHNQQQKVLKQVSLNKTDAIAPLSQIEQFSWKKILDYQVQFYEKINNKKNNTKAQTKFSKFRTSNCIS